MNADPTRDEKHDEPVVDLPDERAMRFVEQRMRRAERESFLREFDTEPAKRRELEDLGRVVELLHATPPVEAPPHFLRDVQGRIRRRTRGRYFGMQVHSRVPWEAIINALLLFALLVVYFVGMPVDDRRVLVPIPAATFQARASDANTAVAILYPFGEVQRLEDAGATRFLVRVPDARVEALALELALYPFLSIDSRKPSGNGVTEVLVRLHAR
jgi:hypothetical protein